MDNVENVKKKKPKKLKFILIMIFIIIPIAIVSILYFNNKTFKSKANNLLGRLPGTMGAYFSSSPIGPGDEGKKQDLADYYISLEPSSAADKLYIMKKEDGKLYSEIIKLMNSKSSSKTEEIIKLVRNLELRKDLLTSIHDEIQNEKENFIVDEVARLENQELSTTINEIEDRMENDEGFKENLPMIINMMKEENVTNILYYIDEGVKNEILNTLDEKKRGNIESKLLAKKTEQNRLEDLASLYEVKPVEVALDEIGNTKDFTIEELGVIYKNLSVLKTAEILSKIDDDNFIEELFKSIRKEEELNGEKTSITTDISKSIQFITEYNKKIDDLVIVYEKMGADKAAKIVENMMGNNKTVTALEINSEPVFEISDATIITDVLSRMRNKTLSNIMNYMSTDKATTLTQMLARP